MNTITIIDQDNQFTFENIGSPTGFEYPDVINTLGDISGKGGAVYLASKFGRRRLSWQGLLKSDVPENRRALERACRAGRLKTIRFSTCDGIALETQVEVESIVMPYKLGRTKYLIQAVSPDWRFMSQVAHHYNVTETVQVGGVDIPAEIPFSFSSNEFTPQVLSNLGTEYAEPVFTIRGPGTRFIITNVTTGEQMIITRTLGVNDFIEVHTDNPSVLLNGVTPIYSSLEGTFWTVPPGDNQITFLSIGSNVPNTVEVDFNDAYLGI